MRLAATACLVVAGLSLLVHHTADFDPTAWLIWGRQLGDGELHTLGGPSWKPLPVLLTTPFSLLGDDPAEALWLVVARAGGLLAVLMTYRVASRLGGRVSGVLAALALVLAKEFLYNAARGDSEGLLVLLTMLAIDQHLSGRPRLALLLGAGTGLLRPEAWPLIGAYGLWIAWRDRRPATLALLPAVAIVLLAAWLVPEHAGSGQWSRAGARAQVPVAGSPGQSAFPFGMVFVNAAQMLTWPVYAGALAAVATRRPILLALAGGATFHMVVVAVMAEGGFTGNLRYVTLPASAVCVLGGVGLPLLVRRLRAPVLRVAAGALAAAGLVASVGFYVEDVELLRAEQRVYGEQLDELIAAQGGRDAVVACGDVGGNHFARQRLAWNLRLRQEDIRTGSGVRRGTVYARTGTGAVLARRPRPERIEYGEWVVRSSCPLTPPPARARLAPPAPAR